MKKAVRVPDLAGNWSGTAWASADTLSVDQFRPESSDHRPVTSAKLLYSDKGIHGIFRVEDRYVRCVMKHYQDHVCQDSCVEFFVMPATGTGYLNFEFNCGGCLLASYIEDPVRTQEEFRKYTRLPESEGRQVKVYHSMPAIVDPEIAGPVEWILEYFVPFSIIKKWSGDSAPVDGSEWRANFYKCADASSHPHWAAWSPVPELNFHEPLAFGEIIFS